MKKLYRYEIEYKSYDGDTRVRLKEYIVFRETEYTYFIGKYYQTVAMVGERLKKVNKHAFNTYAYDTKQKAMDHFVRRTKKRIKWFEYWTDECKKALELIQIPEDRS